MCGNELFPTNISHQFSCLRVFTLILLLSILVPYSKVVAAADADINHKASVGTGSELEDELVLYPRSMDSVTVIGSRLPSFKIPFTDVPANVTYIPANVTEKDKDQIYSIQPNKFQETVKDVEGAIFFDGVGNSVDTTFGLRGFTESSAIIFLVDGVRVNEVDGDVVTYPLIDVSDLESIQIDRGSASPIFGSNAFAGVVHITTGKPSDKPVSLFGGFEFSSFNGYRFHQGVSGTLQDKVSGLGGALKYYFKGGRNLSDGFRSNGEYRMTNFDGKASYELPDDQGRIYFNWKRAEGSISNPGSLQFDAFQADADQSIKPIDGRDRNATIIQVGGDKKFFDDHFIASIMGSQRYNRTEFVSTFATFSAFGEARPDTDRVTIKSRASDLVWQLAYQDDWGKIQNQTTLGMEMRDADESLFNEDAHDGRVAGPVSVNADRYSEPTSAGLFWRESLNYDNVVIAHFGMRHDWHWLTINDNLTPANDLSARWNESTISTGLTVRPVKSVDMFFNYSEGFRVPNISELISPSAFGVSVATGLTPVESQSYEIGSRIRIKDKAHLKGSFFIIDTKDEIVFDGSSRTALAPFGQNINATKSRRIGVETRVDLQPIKEVKAYGSYSWTKAYVRETDPPQPFTGMPALADGRSLGMVPEHRLTFGLVTQPLKSLGDPFEGLKIGLHGVFTGKQHPTSFETATAANLAATGGAGHTIKSYTIWDFILSYDWKGQEIYFKINNLFDNKYISQSVNATSFGSGLLPAGTFNFAVPGAPREFLIGARWEFDSIAEFFSKPKAVS